MTYGFPQRFFFSFLHFFLHFSGPIFCCCSVHELSNRNTHTLLRLRVYSYHMLHDYTYLNIFPLAAPTTYTSILVKLISQVKHLLLFPQYKEKVWMEMTHTTDTVD